MPTAKKKTTTKKAPAKKKAVKKVAKKTAKKTTKKPSQKSPKKTIKKTVSKKRVNSSSTEKKSKLVKKNEDTVTIPTSAGPRIKRKVLAMKEIMEMLETPMYRIAYVSAISFMLVGVFGLMLAYANPAISQLANICLADNCIETDTDPVIDEALSTTNSDSATLTGSQISVLDYADSIPETLDTERKFSLRVRHAETVSLKVVSLQSGDDIFVPVNQLSDQNYQYTLNPEDFVSGTYRVSAELRNLAGIKKNVLGTFRISAVQVEAVSPNTQNQQIENLETEEVVNDSDTSASTTDGVLVNTSQNNNPIQDELVKTDERLQEPSSSSTNKDDDRVSEESSQFELIQLSPVWEGREVVQIRAPSNYRQVRLYVRPESALNARFLGSMFKEGTSWFYTFDSTNLPNGKYEIFATAVIDNGLVTSDSETVVVTNAVKKAPQVITETENNRQYTPTTSLRNFYDVTAIDELGDEEHQVNQHANDIVSDNASELNELMKRYAVAKQSNNSLLTDSIEEELRNKQQQLLTEIVSSPATNDKASQIERALVKRISDIKRRVDAFESVRESRLNETVSKDTDGDGVSDFDELNVYGTNPDSADTDGDGFIDGVEIIRGFNPTDAEPEAIVKYELPTEVVALSRDDVLVINDVTPVVTDEQDSGEPSVFAEISGIGLPNSYVTIYVFSTPVIVTVKTSDDGSFVYRFDRELEDGEHEVYVAFTDNRGSILAHSEPFQFVKRAEAFSPIDTQIDSQLVTAPSVVESTTTSVVRIVLSLIILVLGFFLLMLGINIRETSPKLKTEEVEP